MRRQGGAGDTAEELGIGTLSCHGEGPLASVRVLTIQPRPVDRTAIKARRRSGLETRDGKTKIAKLLRQAVRTVESGGVPDGTGTSYYTLRAHEAVLPRDRDWRREMTPEMPATAILQTV